MSKFECKKCNEQRAIEDFKDLDTMNPCYYCNPPGKPSQKKIDRVNAIGTQDQRAVLESEIVLYLKYKPKKKNVPQKPREVPDAWNSPERLGEIFPLNKKTKRVKVKYEDLAKVFSSAYKQIIFNEKGILIKEFEEQQKIVIINLLKWVIYDKKSIYPLNSNLIIFGNIGVGKSTLVKSVKAAMDYIKRVLKSGTTFDIFELDKEASEMEIDQSLKRLKDIVKPRNYIIDDIQERHSELSVYGSQNIIEKILNPRHLNWKRGIRTILTINMMPEQFNNLVSSRLESRILEEYIFIELKGINKRPLKSE